MSVLTEINDNVLRQREKQKELQAALEEERAALSKVLAPRLAAHAEVIRSVYKKVSGGRKLPTTGLEWAMKFKPTFTVLSIEKGQIIFKVTTPYQQAGETYKIPGWWAAASNRHVASFTRKTLRKNILSDLDLDITDPDRELKKQRKILKDAEKKIAELEAQKAKAEERKARVLASQARVDAKKVARKEKKEEQK